MARAGAPFELIARQLGHRDVAKVYGRFKPDTEERDRWEQAAAARDDAKWSGLVAKRVAKEPPTPEILDEQSPASPWECEASDDSRGGTRTRDPGIMRNGTPRRPPRLRGSVPRHGSRSSVMRRGVQCKRWCNQRLRGGFLPTLIFPDSSHRIPQ
jgi:hypothetical protein